MCDLSGRDRSGREVCDPLHSFSAVELCIGSIRNRRSARYEAEIDNSSLHSARFELAAGCDWPGRLSGNRDTSCLSLHYRHLSGSAPKYQSRKRLLSKGRQTGDALHHSLTSTTMVKPRPPSDSTLLLVMWWLMGQWTSYAPGCRADSSWKGSRLTHEDGDRRGAQAR